MEYATKIKSVHPEFQTTKFIIPLRAGKVQFVMIELVLVAYLRYIFYEPQTPWGIRGSLQFKKYKGLSYYAYYGVKFFLRPLTDVIF